MECWHGSLFLTSCMESWAITPPLIYLIENVDWTFQRLPNLGITQGSSWWSQYWSKPSTAMPLFELRKQVYPLTKQALLKVGQNRVVFQLCLFNCFSIIFITIWLFNALMILTFYNQEWCQQVTELIAQLLEDRMHLFTKAQIHTFG